MEPQVPSTPGRSRVGTAAGVEQHAQSLSLRWSFGGLSKDALNGAHNLSDAQRNAVFFVSGHVGVIYDTDNQTQQLLLGHSNTISSICVSEDRKFIATADEGPHDSLIIVWNAMSATPIATIFNPSNTGIKAMDMTPDASHLATLSNGPSQTLSIWNWVADQTRPVTLGIVPNGLQMDCVRFNNTNPTELVTNGDTNVVFWRRTSIDALLSFVPPLETNTFRHPVGAFTQSTFLPNAPVAASATVDGDVLVWDISVSDSEEEWEIKAVKALRLHNSAIRVLSVTNMYIVTGGDEGFVRFYDHQFRIVAWFEELAAGPISGISFARMLANPYDTSEFKCADFVVSTRTATILNVKSTSWDDVDPLQRRGQLLLQYQSGGVYGIATHPAAPQFAVVGHAGLVQVWDYQTKSLLIYRFFDKLMAHKIAYDSAGKYIALGFTNGTVKLVYASDLVDVPGGSYRQSRDCITELVFSHDGKYLATSDADRCVALYNILEDNDDVIFEYVGKYRAHIKPITGLVFGVESGPNELVRLLSISEDRSIVEYDVQQSSVTSGLVVKNTTRIEQVAMPTAIVWPPRVGKEDFIILASDQYKFKMFNSTTKMCRKTLLGPTYGGPLNKLIMFKGGKYMAYATHTKVVGLIKLPIDGNPNRAIGLIAHPKEVAGIAVSYDGKYLLTVGGADSSVHMWAIDFNVLDKIYSAGGEGIEPFVAMIEGGRDSAFWAEMLEYFYYAQIKHQSEDTMKPRRIGAKVSLTQVPHILRGMGYYPTEREIEDLINELKFENFVNTGEQVEYIDVDELLRVYINHRPVFGISQQSLEEAFRALGIDEGGNVNLDYLLLQLQYKGEQMNEVEIRECLAHLLGEEGVQQLFEKKEISAQEFAEDVLGFEPL